MIWYIFGKSVVYYHIFAMYRSALGSSVVSNIAFPSQPDENGHNDENSVYTFNFPKNGVFVFNNPTILNLGEKSKENELSNHKNIPVVSGMKLLCRLSKVIKNINLRISDIFDINKVCIFSSTTFNVFQNNEDCNDAAEKKHIGNNFLNKLFVTSLEWKLFEISVSGIGYELINDTESCFRSHFNQGGRLNT